MNFFSSTLKMSRTSTVATKNVVIRADDFSSSQSAVTLKTYNSSSSYDFYIPSSNPKYLDGVSGDLQVASQMLTYDVLQQKYVWTQAASSELFLQGQTDSIGNDEHGNVMTIMKEERVVAGDPFYDPAKTADQQVYKASYQFTDKMYNMAELTSGKKEIRTSFSLSVSEISFVSTTATATIPTGHTLVDGTSVTISGVTGDDSAVYNGTFDVTNVTATSFDYTLPSQPSASATNTEILAAFTVSSGVDHEVTTGLYFTYAGGAAAPVGTTDIQKQALDSIVLQTKKEVSGSDQTGFTLEPLKTILQTLDSTSNSKSSVTLTQSTQEIEFSDNAKFSVDNTLKTISTDMDTIKFGPVDNKHRLSVYGSKLYLQKWDGSSWVGADIVVDSINAITATISIVATETTPGKIDVTATLGGTFDHWHVKLDDGSESMAMTGNTFQLDSTYIGKHQVVAYAANVGHGRISEYAVATITTT